MTAKKVECPQARVVGRGGNNANAYYGLVYSNANNASSNSNTNNGSRLTFKAHSGGVVSTLLQSSPLHGYEIATAEGEGHEPRQQQTQVWKAGT